MMFQHTQSKDQIEQCQLNLQQLHKQLQSQKTYFANTEETYRGKIKDLQEKLQTQKQNDQTLFIQGQQSVKEQLQEKIVLEKEIQSMQERAHKTENDLLKSQQELEMNVVLPLCSAGSS